MNLSKERRKGVLQRHDGRGSLGSGAISSCPQIPSCQHGREVAESHWICWANGAMDMFAGPHVVSRSSDPPLRSGPSAKVPRQWHKTRRIGLPGCKQQKQILINFSRKKNVLKDSLEFAESPRSSEEQGLEALRLEG